MSVNPEKEKALEYQALTVDRDRLESELFVLDVLDAQAKAAKKAAEVRAHETRAAELADELVQAEKDSKEAKEALEAIAFTSGDELGHTYGHLRHPRTQRVLEVVFDPRGEA